MLQYLMMMIIRRAQPADQDAVFRILKELDLDYSLLTFDHFWVVEEDGEITTVARLEEFRDFYFLSSVGTAKNAQGRGTATKLLDGILKDCGKDVYLYTIIPGFFRRIGFAPSPFPCGLPAREIFNCEDCDSRKCVCMKWSPGTALRRKPEGRAGAAS